MIRVVHPEALLLLPLVALLLRGRCWPRAAVGSLRVLLVLALALLLAEVAWLGVADGRDVVLVVDRSASMPAGALPKVRELADELAKAQPPGDRVGVVSFGRSAVVESLPQAPFHWPETSRTIDADASDLAAAIEAALALLPTGRQGSLLVVGDGEANGGDLAAAARASVRQGVRIDTMLVAREVGPDVAVVDLQAPSHLPRGEPLAVSAVVATSAAGPARYRLFVDGVATAEGSLELTAGRNVLQFQPTLDEVGEHEIAVEVQRAGDPRPDNDRATVVVQADGPRRVLVVAPGGRDDRFAAALRTAGLDVLVVAPSQAPSTLAALAAFRVVVLEDVPAQELPAGAMRALATWVQDLGGGLLMTGGKSSFGIGGYHRSPVEAVLPVTMEIREEQRRFGLALAIALDCSGSMRVMVDGTTKMQLANRGAASAIELLSPIDAVAVLAVDDRAHVVVPMQPAELREALAEQALGIDVGGGGIYVAPALRGGAEQLRSTPQEHKHLLLFADAADASRADDYETLVPELVREGITVSVIGLGSAGDADAALLQRIARLGGGRCQFVADATELPRVFAQETIQVARSSVVEAPTPIAVRPGLAMLGDLPGDMPPVGGYSMAWLRPRAEVALATADAQAAPFLAHWQVGLGRAAAFLGEVDGPLAGGLATWPRYGAFCSTLVRWLAGGQPEGLYVQAWREGGVAVYSLEMVAARAALLDGVRGQLLAPDGRTSELVFERSPGRLLARVPLLRPGLHRAAVQVDGATVVLPPLCLPYSPEFTLETDARLGERTLRQLAQAAGGVFEPTTAMVLAGERRSAGAIPLDRWFAVLALVSLLAEIAVRRLRLFARGAASATPVRVVAGPAEAARAAAPAAAAEAGLLGALRRARRRSDPG